MLNEATITFSITYLSIIYLAGILSFLSPCIFPIIPVYLSILSNGEKKSISRTFAFILGLATTFFILGFGAGILGEFFFNEKVRIIGGLIIILLGLFQMEIIKLNFLEKTKIIDFNSKNNGIFAPFMLGLTFSLGWTPCVGPVLGSILIASASSGNTLQSILMLGVYVLGLATPFVIFSIISKVLLQKISFIKKYLGTLKKIGGFIIILMGLALIFDRMNIFLNF